MKFKNLNQCIDFVEKEGELVRIQQKVDPDLEMAEITRRVFDAGGPALLFENVKGSRFRALSNLYGTYERCIKIFEPQLEHVRSLIDLKISAKNLIKKPLNSLKAVNALVHSMPLKTGTAPVLKNKTRIENLPRIKCWPKDGGGFILLPQVLSMDPDKNGIQNSNLGMYRVQISGNNYIPNQEIGLHYQIHRGIGNHHEKAIENNEPLKVSIFIGGPPAHALAAVMPLPEGMPEVFFAGALAGRNFRYCYQNGFIISADADFCITGRIYPGKTKKEGPFGDHLGYYSLAHDFPYLEVESVFHKDEAVFPFTVVGRPPQEDSNFGRLIHEITRQAVQDEISGVTAINAVDEAGVHPLLLAKANERYVPYEKREPREILTAANAILGTGQLSLAKYLLICAHEDCPELDITNTAAFFKHVLERADFNKDLHFHTHTTIDTLDYSSKTLNQGSKLVIAVAGAKKRELGTTLYSRFSLPVKFSDPKICAPGIVAVKGMQFTDYDQASIDIKRLSSELRSYKDIKSLPLFVVVDDSFFVSNNFSNFLWVTFTRSNPSHDIHGADEFYEHKHWGCSEPLVIDARIKPFHAEPLKTDLTVKKKVDALGKQGGTLFGII